MTDEGFHEIQLSGKQLVFLFMATTVVSVVIFLCGVLVGRGVRAQRGQDFGPLASALAAAAPVGAAQPTAAPPSPAVEPPAPADEPPAQAAAEAVDELSYYKRLEGEGNAPETLKDDPPPPAPAPKAAASPAKAAPAVEKPSQQPSPASTPAPAAASTTKPAAGAASAPAPPPTPPAAVPAPAGAYTIQVAALRERGEAAAIIQRLSGKGYEAYLLEPGAGAPAPVFRVRVGKFKDRRAAEPIVRRLEREEQFKPWITR